MKVVCLGKYTNEAWKGMIGSSFQERKSMMEKVCENAGARLVDIMFTRGEFDIMVTLDVPSEDIALGAVVAVNASGSVKELCVLTEINIDKCLETARKVTGTYVPPGG